MSSHYLIKDRVVIQFTVVPPEAAYLVTVKVGFNPPVATTIEAARNLWASTIDKGATVATMEQVLAACLPAGKKRNQK